MRRPGETFRDLLSVARDLLERQDNYDALGALTAATVGADPEAALEAGEAVHRVALNLGADGVESYAADPDAYLPRTKHIGTRQRVIDLFDRALEASAAATA